MSTIHHGEIVGRKLTANDKPGDQMRQRKYVSLSDWEVVRAMGGDPGPRPLTDLTLDPLPTVASSEQLPGLRGGLYSDPDGDERRRRHDADRALEAAGIKPRPW